MQKVMQALNAQWGCVQALYSGELCSSIDHGDSLRLLTLLLLVAAELDATPGAPLGDRLVWVLCGTLRVELQATQSTKD